MVLDNVASEVRKTVKSAIKAKLTEIGIYVDDELPDYIMIMIGNKRTKDQMDEDLSLFLGHNTERFTSWLHHVLQKLNAASVLQTEDPKTGKEEKKKKDDEKSVTSEEPKPVEEKKKHKKKKDKSEKKKEKKEKKKKKDKDREKHSKSQKMKDKDGLSKSKSKSPVERNETDEGSPRNSSSIHAVKSSVKSVHKNDALSESEDDKHILVTESVDLQKNEEELPNEDVVNLRPNEEDLALGLEDDTNVKKLKSKVEHQASKELDLPVQPLNIEIKVDNTSGREITSKVIADASDTEVTTSGVHERLGPKRVINLREESSFPSKNTSSEGMGRVVSSAIASAVKSVSVSGIGKSSEGKTAKKLEARVRPLVSSRIKVDETSNDSSLPSRVVSTVGAVLKRSHSQDDSDDNDEPPTKRLTGLASKVEVTPRPRRPGSMQANTALILRAVADAHKSVNKPNRKGVEEKDEAKPRKEIFTKSYQERQNQRLSSTSEPKSIKKFAITVPNALLKESLDEDFAANSLGEAYADEIEMSSEDALPKEQRPQDISSSIKQNILPQLKKISSTPMQVDDSAAGSTRFIVTLDGFGNEVTSSDLRSRISGRPVRTPSVDEEEFIEEVEEWEEIEEMEGISSQGTPVPERPPTTLSNYAPKWKAKIDASDLGTKKEERCRYWPSCKEGAACQYVHPSKLCIMFPSCKFGDKCIYIHPNCKFDSACTKLNCPFTHTSLRGIPMIGSKSLIKTKIPIQKSKIKCKYYPKCIDMNCPFMHPKQICKYGKTCQTPSCMYVHPEVTTGSLLKWTAPKPAEKKLGAAPPEDSASSSSSILNGKAVPS